MKSLFSLYFTERLVTVARPLLASLVYIAPLYACSEDPSSSPSVQPNLPVVGTPSPENQPEAQPDLQPETQPELQPETQPPSPPESDAGVPPTGPPKPGGGPVPMASPLIISELVASNDGVGIDEQGETDDYIELTNRGTEVIELDRYSLSDDAEHPHDLPAEQLAPGETVLLWADDSPEQGAHHLPFKLSASADHVRLHLADEVVQDASITQLAPNEALMWFSGSQELVRCRYASPGRPNGEQCIPPQRPTLADVTFQPFDWPEPARPAGPLVISEVALNPARFVELRNSSDAPLDLSDYELRLSAHRPGEPWPDNFAGVTIDLPNPGVLAPFEVISVDVTSTDTQALAARPEYEGVLSLFSRTSTAVIDRVDFMRWPQGASLARLPDDGPFRYCTTASRDMDNDCELLPSRDVGDRIRHLRTPGDYAALAAGTKIQGVSSVKWVADLQARGVVHLLSSDWALHYTFVREEIYGEPALDRCDPAERQTFDAGWYAFSETEYFQVAGRRFLLGTLSHYPSSAAHAVEYTPGDAVSPQQMLTGFQLVTAHLLTPQQWALRPQNEDQVQRARQIEGDLPIIGPNAPFADIHYQGLTAGVGYGTLRFIPATELQHQPLGPKVIVLTDEVPNDIPFVGGLITEAFQTPLAHVNVLSQGRNTPNMALPNARSDERISPWLDKLVKLEVDSSGFTMSEADPAEAQAFWEAQVPEREVYTPAVDTTVTDLVPLDGQVGIAALPAIGAKAAQLDELARVPSTLPACGVELTRPDTPLAIPVAHYLDHLQRSGAATLLATHLGESEFYTDPDLRRPALAEVRRLIEETPVDSQLLALIDSAVAERFGERRVRFRSSSNVEDLATFSGAGIYTSQSAQRGDPERRIDDALRTVWASLWDERAFDERQFARVDHSQVAMGVLVHPAFLSERGNGVGISRNIRNPERGDQFYYNLQFGEASVTNPAPGVTTEQVVVQRPPRAENYVYEAASSLASGHVMSTGELTDLSCVLAGIHSHFQALLDPDDENLWFAMEIEFKLMGEERSLYIKQARPYSFGSASPVGDCREL